MIRFLKNESILIALVALSFCFHWFSKDITNPYQRPIAGDAQAYWSYLPALFIYQDLDYDFVAEKAAQYYPEGYLKDFVQDVDGEKVNKTFPGVAVLYAPFFALAHVSAHVFGFPPDGFSTIYQFWFDIGLWVYFFFALVFLRKLLKKLGFSSKIALFSTVFIVFGTNVWFYTVYDQSVTHIYNLFMINGMLLSLVYWRDTRKMKWLGTALVLLCLIGITRPTNFLVFGLILFIFDKKQDIIDLFKSIFSKKALIYYIPVLAVLLLPFLLWKAQTGNWIVYSYGEEGFDFANPHFFEFLFSYTKGWFVYTPLALMTLITGLILLFKKSKYQFTVALTFYLVATFIFSSWWCWYYGAGMSQRVMIDHYFLLAFLFALILKFVWEKKLLLYAFFTLVMCFSLLNIVQAFQIANGILPNGSPTKDAYWDNFMQLEKRAVIYPQDHWELKDEIDVTAVDWELEVGPTAWYSKVVGAPCTPLRSGSKFILSFETYTDQSIELTRAVMLLNNKTTGAEDESHPFYLSEFSYPGKWVKMEFLFEPSDNYEGYMELFFWNGDSQEEMKFRNVKVQHYWTDEYF